MAAWKLSRDVPEMETCDMELDSGSRIVKVRDHVLPHSHGLLAGVAGLTMARAARVGREGRRGSQSLPHSLVYLPLGDQRADRDPRVGH